jgi:hypothetical protein
VRKRIGYGADFGFQDVTENALDHLVENHYPKFEKDFAKVSRISRSIRRITGRGREVEAI